ncbi:hypothetical protein L1987_71200 [Smallanthus sonchifolius]|uniref:Uncharacterized protein n=1 Tax=Smallanthus sonchifolius TaxID=185202 RepID=A0ACB9ARS9_9ASTR|nr:hypothetical protein L1987_71200 [Smallanthus sonchifolius]
MDLGVGRGSTSLSELQVISRLTAGWRGDFSIGGWFDLVLLVGDGIMEIVFGRERVFLRERRSKSGDFRLGVAGWRTGRPLMSETVVVGCVATSFDSSNLESEEHMIDEFLEGNGFDEARICHG